ncbi:MAG TPA: hypothetical protein GX521_08990 [Firmicutes bacterium]|nr:hypothetical protein [Bacillota bacterium]
MEIRPGVWQVWLDEALMKELDGWRAQARLLQFTFDKHLAETYGADLICEGSYRLGTITRLIRRQGLLAKAHLDHKHFYEPNVRRKVLENLGAGKRVYVISNRLAYCPYLGLQLLASRFGLQKKESIHFPMVNLSSGEVLLKFPISTHLFSSGPPQKEKTQEKKISYKQAFTAATGCLAELYTEGDLSWAEEALGKMAREMQKLASFYEDTADTAFYEPKAAEIKKRFYPRLEITALRAALLFIPLFQYRCMVVDPSGSEEVTNVCYDPVTNLQKLS